MCKPLVVIRACEIVTFNNFSLFLQIEVWYCHEQTYSDFTVALNSAVDFKACMWIDENLFIRNYLWNFISDDDTYEVLSIWTNENCY